MDATIIILILLGLLLFSAFNILREYERGVIFMLGRYWKVKGPGLISVIPGIQKMGIYEESIKTKSTGS